MKSLTSSIDKKIKQYIKNKLDISELIADVDLRNANLSGAIIKKLDRIYGDLRNCNFSNCTFGEKGKKINLARANLDGCNFKGAVFLGTVVFRNSSLRNCNFSDGFFPFVEYQYADFTGSNFCRTVWMLCGTNGRGAKIDKDIFRKWGVELI